MGCAVKRLCGLCGWHRWPAHHQCLPQAARIGQRGQAVQRGQEHGHPRRIQARQAGRRRHRGGMGHAIVETRQVLGIAQAGAGEARRDTTFVFGGQL